jgi:hypothetical protein
MCELSSEASGGAGIVETWLDTMCEIIILTRDEQDEGLADTSGV